MRRNKWLVQRHKKEIIFVKIRIVTWIYGRSENVSQEAKVKMKRNNLWKGEIVRGGEMNRNAREGKEFTWKCFFGESICHARVNYVNEVMKWRVFNNKTNERIELFRMKKIASNLNSFSSHHHHHLHPHHQQPDTRYETLDDRTIETSKMFTR